MKPMSIDTSVQFQAMIHVKCQWQPFFQICNLEPPGMACAAASVHRHIDSVPGIGKCKKPVTATLSETSGDQW